MSDLENRIARLEGSLKGQGTIWELDVDTDSLIRKLGLDPDAVRATARANGQPIGEVIASELGMSFKDFKKALRLKARGKDTS